MSDGRPEDQDQDLNRSTGGRASEQQQVVGSIPETVDDYLRNFLLRMGLRKTLDCFQKEWYKILQNQPQRSFIPDALTEQSLVQSELRQVREEAGLVRRQVNDVNEACLTLHRELDFHLKQQQRALDQKEALWSDLTRLRQHRDRYDPALTMLTTSYNTALRARTLVEMETQRLRKLTKNEKIKTSETAETCRVTTQEHDEDKMASGGGPRRDGQSEDTSELTPFNTEQIKMDVIDRCGEEAGLSRRVTGETSPAHFSLTCSIRAHHQPISCIDIHPIRRLVASASDDHTWKLWALPTNQERVGALLLSGEGHSDWLTSCSFNLDGDRLASSSGDSTVRVWDLLGGRCLFSLPHPGASVWGCSFHPSGGSLASASSDRTVRLWDLTTARPTSMLRHHDNAVSSVHFLRRPEHFLLSASRDRTLVLWDTRTNVCGAVFRGHLHPCNYATGDSTGRTLASCDAGGVVKLWDVRRPRCELVSLSTHSSGANQVCFVSTATEVGVAGADGQVRLVQVNTGQVTTLTGHVTDDHVTDDHMTVHRGQVSSVRFHHHHHQGETLLSAGHDGTIRVWTRERETTDKRL